MPTVLRQKPVLVIAALIIGLVALSSVGLILGQYSVTTAQLQDSSDTVAVQWGSGITNTVSLSDTIDVQWGS